MSNQLGGSCSSRSVYKSCRRFGGRFASASPHAARRLLSRKRRLLSRKHERKALSAITKARPQLWLWLSRKQSVICYHQNPGSGYYKSKAPSAITKAKCLVVAKRKSSAIENINLPFAKACTHAYMRHAQVCMNACMYKYLKKRMSACVCALTVHRCYHNDTKPFRSAEAIHIFAAQIRHFAERRAISRGEQKQHTNPPTIKRI